MKYSMFQENVTKYGWMKIGAQRFWFFWRYRIDVYHGDTDKPSITQRFTKLGYAWKRYNELLKKFKAV